MSPRENDVETAVVPRLDPDPVESTGPEKTAETAQPPPRAPSSGVMRLILIGVAVLLGSTALTVAILYALR